MNVCRLALPLNLACTISSLQSQVIGSGPAPVLNPTIQPNESPDRSQPTAPIRRSDTDGVGEEETDTVPAQMPSVHEATPSFVPAPQAAR